MPKIKDLGIKVIPEQMRPAECLPYSACACTHIASCALHTTITICIGCTYFITKLPCITGTITACYPGTLGNPCAGSWCSDPVYQQSELTHEQISALREQLRSQMDALDEYAKSAGPRTAEEIDARVNTITEELNRLKARRKEVK